MELAYDLKKNVIAVFLANESRLHPDLAKSVPLLIRNSAIITMSESPKKLFVMRYNTYVPGCFCFLFWPCMAFKVNFELRV